MADYEEKFKKLCHEAMTELFLEHLNDVGQKIGYPFVMYSNGEFGKGLVSEDKKHNAVLKVLKPFKEGAKVQEVQECTDGANAVSSTNKTVNIERIKEKVSLKVLLTEDEEIALFLNAGKVTVLKYLDYQRLLSLGGFKEMVRRGDIDFYVKVFGNGSGLSVLEQAILIALAPFSYVEQYKTFVKLSDYSEKMYEIRRRFEADSASYPVMFMEEQLEKILEIAGKFV